MDIEPIAIIRSDFEDRFGIPRQPGLVPAATAEVRLNPPFNDPDALRGLAGCSHVWLIFGFHAIDQAEWRPTVRPPRLGGNQRYGVFATRAPFRPNGLGLSLVRLEGVLDEPARGLAISGQDLLDGTPVYDIKPYMPAIEALPDARPPIGFEGRPETIAVSWSPAARAALPAASPQLGELIEQTVAADPRPAYQRGDGETRYGMRLHGHEVTWEADGTQARITAVAPVTDSDRDTP
ncbi:tRNA (N6-threonylcarbamoyladenosine(37)-N6)-methyltransferase TrmO [Spiribacter onubensis]|uniref:tRNA (N6-threonylcarbamoyladenosine(37)-N6)-methyltransferase TrmO n=1 Tax=Spiribacter onubensis TaxID=3122420 RepID=A0ABV3S826_9GAMM